MNSRQLAKRVVSIHEVDYVSCVIEFPPFHRRVLDAALDICQELGLYLAGGYAVKAHGLVDRPSQDLDLATDSLRPLSEVIDRVSRAYRDAAPCAWWRLRTWQG